MTVLPLSIIIQDAESRGIPVINWTYVLVDTDEYELQPSGGGGGGGGGAAQNEFQTAPDQWEGAWGANNFLTASGISDSGVIITSGGSNLRLMGYMMEISGDSTISGGSILVLTFAPGNLIHNVYIPDGDPLPGVLWSTGYINLGPFGQVLGTDNLEIDFSTSLDSGGLTIQLYYNQYTP